MSDFAGCAKGIVLVATLIFLQTLEMTAQDNWQWEIVSAKGKPTARHEAGLVAYKDKIILIGGRRINPTDIFDTRSYTWEAKSAPLIELHHFQPVVIDDAIYIVGAMTGGWPTETPVGRVVVYYPERDEYVYKDPIPEHRRRGGAGAAVYNGKIYLLGGITNGHMQGYVDWFDEYDPQTGQWRTLPNAPNTRDHFHAVVVGHQLYAFAGRRTSHKTGEDMALTVRHANIFNFRTGTWETVNSETALPTLRAGNGAFVWHDEIVIGGGESAAQVPAHAEVEAFDTRSYSWRNWPAMKQGRHGSGYGIVGDYVYTASGCGNRGGEPELYSVERLKLPKPIYRRSKLRQEGMPVYSQWHTLTLDFSGPQTSETASDNPFLNYRLVAEFTHSDTSYVVRGFYAGDGNAAESGADEGNVWQVRFTPDRPGKWQYSAQLHHGKNITLNDDMKAGKAIDIPHATGEFLVTSTDKQGVDFRAQGRIGVDQGYFQFTNSGKYWLKTGADSPENLLGFADFDGTYRISAADRSGEAQAGGEIHRYEPHLRDWQTGNPIWRDGIGKGLIGAINYLASTGMNSVYFLTMNINGDGKDVWPYRDPDVFDRFDVSRLAQWEIVFQHMQSKGILMHIVLQETENETMLDKGDTGPQRQLYLRELVARFGHHPGLVWNMGEENGPAPWSPIAQNDQQSRAMASFIKQIDPYQHPVVLHTHSYEPVRSHVLDKIVGFKDLDGLSLQVDKREGAPAVVETWKQKSIASGHEWLISMDEIGMWYVGALPDAMDPQHESLRRHVLWGTLLSGAAGVEWYFGARNVHNDLTSEDWRERANLWRITNVARQFFEDHLPYWEMQPAHQLIDSSGWCLRKPGEVYAAYFTRNEDYQIDLGSLNESYSVYWYDPLLCGELQAGSITKVSGGGIRDLGTPPKSRSSYWNKQDWVVLIRKMEKK